MVIANLMASVLALAMVGASTASVSKVENVSAGSDVVLNADLHKAYYDPAETYGTSSNTFYNYTSGSLNLGLIPFSEGESEYYTLGSVDADSSCSMVENALGSYGPVKNSDPASLISYGSNRPFENLPLDFYVDGEFLGTYSPYLFEESEDYTYWVIPFADYTSYEAGWTNFIEISSGSFVWVFDHQEAQPYTPVDMLGDIAEGLTGGIVPVAEGIGSGLQSLVQDIFLNAEHDGLSVFGIVIICFAGLALALGLSRWVLNFVDSLGARDR